MSKKYNRLFAFGCSFTGHKWPTWANILSIEYNLPLYNYGVGGAGNQFIFNNLMQADSFYNFTENDLIGICWTNVSREDRYKDGTWITPGNIYSQSKYDKNFVEKYADPVFFGLRDFAVIKASIEFIKSKKCDYHLFKLAEFDLLDQWNQTLVPQKYKDLLNLYKPYLDQICPSYYATLYNNDINEKFAQEKIDIGKNMNDGHPFVTEHATYLERVLNKNLSESTKEVVNLVHNKIVERLKKENEKNKLIEVWNMDFSDLQFGDLKAVQRI